MSDAGSGFHYQTDELSRAGVQVRDFADRIDQHTTHLGSVLQQTSGNAGRDRSGVGSVLHRALGSAGETFAKFGGEAHRVTDKSGQNLVGTAKNHQENEKNVRGSFERIFQRSTRPGKMSEDEYEKFRPNWKQSMDPGPDKTWLWSGGHKIDAKFRPGGGGIDPETDKPIKEGKYLGSVEKKARKLAQNNGGNTLEGQLHDSKIKMPKWGEPNAEKIWKDASKSLAHNAKGEVHVVLPNTPGKSSGFSNHGDKLATRRDNNVFDMDEFPILRHNPNVTKIVVHDMDHGTEHTIWNKGDSAPVPPSRTRPPIPHNVPPGEWMKQQKEKEEGELF